MQSGHAPKAADYYQNINVPNVSDMQVQLDTLVQQGVITPEDAQAALVGASDMNGITLDPSLKKAQMDALTGLQDISEGGGLTASDKAKLAHIASDEMTQQRGQREAILNNAQARGLGGSGLELMAQLQNQQDSATRQSQKDLDVAGMAQDRALQALMQGGQLAGQIGSQDFSQQAQIAGANDAIAKFNAQNQQNVNLTNTAAHNTAQAQNLAAKQDIANQNANLRNQQQLYNKQLLQQNYDNQLKRAAGQQGVASTNAQLSGQNSQNAANAANNTIGTVIGAGANLIKSDEKAKKDMKEMSTDDFLDNITGYKYKYKDPQDGDKSYGPMAQDLEKSDIGKSMVQDTPQGKVVDSGKAAMAALGALSDLHNRLKKLEE